MNAQSTPSVLFVCLGNICRSPTGEGVFRSLIRQRGMASKFLVDSAGTIDVHTGHPADLRMKAAAERRGYQLLSRSRQINRADLESFNLVIAMDRSNFKDIHTFHPAPQSEIKLLSDFLADEWPADVPDPYYGGPDGFEYVLDMIEAACPAILKHLDSLR